MLRQRSSAGNEPRRVMTCDSEKKWDTPVKVMEQPQFPTIQEQPRFPESQNQNEVATGGLPVFIFPFELRVNTQRELHSNRAGRFKIVLHHNNSRNEVGSCSAFISPNISNVHKTVKGDLSGRESIIFDIDLGKLTAAPHLSFKACISTGKNGRIKYKPRGKKSSESHLVVASSRDKVRHYALEIPQALATHFPKALPLVGLEYWTKSSKDKDGRRVTEKEVSSTTIMLQPAETGISKYLA